MSNHPASFRDPAGHVYLSHGVIRRQVNSVYFEQYSHLFNSGLYKKLTETKKLLRHEELEKSENAIVIQPERLPFVSYPSEWCFSQLKSAALLTLEILELAFLHQMTLKDASVFNIQFVGSRPVFIDTLSFDFYKSGQPWYGYGQFCRHFLAPLLLMKYRDHRLNQLFIQNIDGIPLDLTAQLLPQFAKLRPGVYMHIVMHAKLSKTGNKIQLKTKPPVLSENSYRGLLDNMKNLVSGLNMKKVETEWGDYYDHANHYSEQDQKHKNEVLNSFIHKIDKRGLAIDLGANAGVYSRTLSQEFSYVLSCDIDPIAVEKNFLNLRANHNESILPLLLDITNPSPSYGWANIERTSFLGRAKPDLTIALALIHHLTLRYNIPFKMSAPFFNQLTPWLVMEFVPLEDEQAQKVVHPFANIDNYSQQSFELEYGKYFDVIAKSKVGNTNREMYLLRRKT